MFQVEGRGSPRKPVHLSSEDFVAGPIHGPPIGFEEAGLRKPISSEEIRRPINSEEAGLHRPISSEDVGLRHGAPLSTERHVLLRADKVNTAKNFRNCNLYL